MMENKAALGRLIKVLVIESDVDLRNILSELFDLEGYEFVIYPKSFDIVEQVIDYHPDVVILDYRLPLVNGCDLCNRLKQDPKTNYIPVIIYSVAPVTLIDQLEIDHDIFIAKPFNLDELLTSIERLVQQPVKSK